MTKLATFHDLQGTSVFITGRGPITTLVNNAANDNRHTTQDVSSNFFDEMIAINLKAYFFASQAVVPYVEEVGSGTSRMMTGQALLIDGGVVVTG